MKSLLTGIGLVAAGLLSAATLNVELTVSHGISVKEQSAVGRNRRVAYFVIDRSGSMDDTSLEGGRKPNDALLESLKLRLAALPDGASVYVIPFSSTIKALQAYPSLDASVRRKIIDFVAKDEPRGQTLLYDAQDFALTEAARTMQRNSGVEVSVYVYTDGLHLTPYNYEGEYPARSQLKKKIGRGFVDNPNYVVEKNAAYAKFKSKWSEFAARPDLELEYEWLSRSAKPDTSNWGTKPRIATELTAPTSALKNPLMDPDQNVNCQLFLPITDGCWNEIKGNKVTLDFDVDGKRVSKSFDLKEGKSVLKLDWPYIPDDAPVHARLELKRMPCGKKFDLKSPKPLEFTVPPRGKASVSIASPAKDAVVPVGVPTKFSAMASDSADVRWSIGGEVLRGANVEWSAKTAGRVNYSATASKGNLKEASANGVLEVIPTGVKIASPAARHEVGKKSVFQAEAVGPCLRYAWTVDGMRVPGDKSAMEYVFDKSGRHQIGVTAIYKAGITKDAEHLDVSVSAAPFVEILSPVVYDGDPENAQYQAERPINLLARVEGDLTTLSWQFKLKDKAMAVTTDVNGGRSTGRYTPPKGGYYDVVVTAKGPAGEKSKAVQIFVKSSEVRVDITSPTANQDIETGKEFDLSAVTKGPVKNVRWKMVDKATAKPVAFGASDVSAVIDGKTAIKAKLPLEIGNASLEVTAEPIIDDKEIAESVQPSSLLINVSTSAAINYTQEALSQNWRRVKYGSQVTLGVTTSGAIKKGSVVWVTFDSTGKNEKMLEQKGESINVVIPDVRGQAECPFDYLARGLRQDGIFEDASKGQRITIQGCCPCVLAEENERPRIEMPKTNGVMRTSFGLTDAVHVSLGPKGLYEVAAVSWDMGDGTVYTNRGTSTEHQYKKYGEYTIKASGHCARCNSSFDVTSPAAVVIEPQPINAEFKLSPSGYVAQGRQVALKGMDTPDIARREWTCNGELLKDDGGKPKTDASIEVWCRDVGDMEFALTVFDAKGNAMGPVMHTVRVYRLWVVVLAFILALAVSGFFWWYFSGDDPRFWRVCGFVDETNSKDPSAVESEMLGFRRIFKFWDTMWNKATIPLHVLGGAQAEDWGSGTALGQTGLMLWESKTAADDGQGVRMPNCDLMNRPEGMEKESFSRGQLIHIWAPSPSNAQTVTALWVKIKMGRDVPNTYLWVRLGIALLCFGLAAAVSYFFAF